MADLTERSGSIRAREFYDRAVSVVRATRPRTVVAITPKSYFLNLGSPTAIAGTSLRARVEFAARSPLHSSRQLRPPYLAIEIAAIACYDTGEFDRAIEDYSEALRSRRQIRLYARDAASVSR